MISLISPQPCSVVMATGHFLFPPPILFPKGQRKPPETSQIGIDEAQILCQTHSFTDISYFNNCVHCAR